MDKPAEEKRKVRVACGVTNGLRLSLYEMVDVGMGIKEARATGETVMLTGPQRGISADRDSPIENEIDAEFWGKWLDQNKQSDLVTGHLVRAVDDKGKDEAR